MEAAHADKPMLPVTCDAHSILSAKFRMCPNCQVSFLTWICPVIPSTYCIMVLLHVSSLIAAEYCPMSAT